MNRFNINKLSLRKSIVRVALALILTVAILAIYMQISIQMTKDKLEKYAEIESQQKASSLKIITNMIFMSNEWVVNSFLAGVANMSFQYDSTYKDVVCKYICEDDVVKTFTINDIYKKLESFISYNNEFYSAAMVFEPGVIKDAPNGVAAVAYSHDSIGENINIDDEFFNSGFYESVKEFGGIKIQDGMLSADSLMVVMMAHPLYNEAGTIIGEFWLEIEADFYTYMLETYMVDKDVISAIIDDDCKVISCVYEKYNGKNLSDIIVNESNSPNLYGWLNDLQSHLMLKKSCHFRNEIFNEKYMTYLSPIRNTTFNLLTIKPEKKIYSAVKHFTMVSIGIMSVSILLISICLIYIFFIFKRKNDESNRMENELDVASEIQRGILPPNPQNTDNQQYDIYGFQRPAKSVGGDLYDFVQKGDFLHFCIGDVSGKGMPAALVMTELCSLYRYIICYHSDPQEIVTLINKAVMERSDDSMFCTLFVGVLNLKTGMLEFCNAGHNPPIFIGKENSEINYLKIKPNMPIYAFENFKYQKESLLLKTGDRLFVYTDGVTEAKNESNEFMGNEFTLKLIQKVKNQPFNLLIDNFIKDLRAFTGKAEQNDDITILCVEYKGANDCVSLHYEKVKDNVTKIVDDVVDNCGLDDDMKFRLAIEEPVQNIADYAYETDGAVDIEISKIIDNKIIEITLIDNGKAFNPLESKLPDLSVPIEEREIGGLGIFLTRKIMEEVAYEYVNQQNRLKLKYKIK